MDHVRVPYCLCCCLKSTVYWCYLAVIPFTSLPLNLMISLPLTLSTSFTKPLGRRNDKSLTFCKYNEILLSVCLYILSMDFITLPPPQTGPFMVPVISRVSIVRLTTCSSEDLTALYRSNDQQYINFHVIDAWLMLIHKKNLYKSYDTASWLSHRVSNDWYELQQVMHHTLRALPVFS